MKSWSHRSGAQLTSPVKAFDLILVADGPSPAGEEGEEEDGSVRVKDI